jgi:glycosyltransferase involved in cell wall biosynthesis
MTPGLPSVTLLYDDSAYVETVRPSSGGEGPAGLVGRQVAGHEFLDAYLTHGDWNELSAVVWNQASADSLAALCRQHPRACRHTPRILLMDRFLEVLGHSPPPILYTPCPPDPSFAWARLARGPGAFSLSGVTHTLCTAGAARLLGDMLTAPYESHDALICTSTAVVRMVRALTGAYADYLGERFGCAPVLRPRLEMIPLGVNPDRFRPATAQERAARRAELNIRPEAVAVLFVGRFTPHAKAHPFPMFQGLARAARDTGQPIHLILSGWAASEVQMRLYLDGLRAFAPGVPVSVVKGTHPDLRFGVWQAADLYTSLADSIQETFGLVVIEAMASALPVVATDWDGYRDLVVDGQTGCLVPTAMVRGATVDTTLRLLLGAVDYDAFLAECNQAVVVDPDAAASAYARLLTDSALRLQMGAAGRERVLQHFTWERVVRAYEELWRQQDAERRGHAAQVMARPGEGPPCYPSPELSFAGYPTGLLDAEALVCAAPGAVDELARILTLPLCTYAGQRVKEELALRAALERAAAPVSLGELATSFGAQAATAAQARATVAWLLKYGLLKRVDSLTAP